MTTKIQRGRTHRLAQKHANDKIIKRMERKTDSKVSLDPNDVCMTGWGDEALCLIYGHGNKIKVVQHCFRLIRGVAIAL